jgi:L-threonylcarbamoyladenylate synthase
MNLEEINVAAQTLLDGKLLGLPTETVYGLAADATNDAALHAIFALKGRPQNHPLIIHLHDEAKLDDWAINIPHTARALAKAFWPGPLTLILQRAPHVSQVVTGGQDTVGLRCPAHPHAQAVLKRFAALGGSGAVAAPSANRFGRLSPTTAAHVREEFARANPPLLVLDGGTCEVGIESTIVDCSRLDETGQPVILRPGAISATQIAAILGGVHLGKASAKTATPRVSGSLDSHYAPQTEMVLVPSDVFDDFVVEKLMQGAVVGTLRFADAVTTGAAEHPASDKDLRVSKNAKTYAHDLYANLRKLDHAHCDLIAVEAPPTGMEWAGVWDRLSRGAHRE